MKWLSSFWRWTKERLKDLFYSTGNEHLDFSRCFAGFSAALTAFAVYWNAIVMGEAIDLNALLLGLASLAGGLGLGIAFKEWARRKVHEIIDKKGDAT